MSSSASSKSDAQVLVLDMGTTHAKAFVIDASGAFVSEARCPVPSYRPMEGWVEQDPAELVAIARKVLRQAYAGRTGPVVAMGLATQRESVVAWSPHDGQPLYPSINWQDRRTAEQCRDMARTEAHRQLVRERTGLTIAPYFSASKLHWLTNHTDTLGSRMGTIDSWLLYNLVEGRPHLTDRTNAALTMLFNIRTLDWDEELLKLWGLHEGLLPEVRPSFSDFGALRADVVGEPLPVRVVMGDQQASLYAAGTEPGTVKVTYGTGMFVMKLLGATFQLVDDTLTTLAVGKNDNQLYALEDAIGPAAARVGPVRDKPAQLARVLGQLSTEVAASLQLMLTPHDHRVIIDGGISQNDQLLAAQQKLLLDIKVFRQSTTEGTALGVAKLTIERLFQEGLS